MRNVFFLTEQGKGSLPTFWLIDGPRDHSSREMKTDRPQE